MENKEKAKLDVKIHLRNIENDTTKAYASVSIDDLIAIRGIRVVDGSKGLFVSMPQSKDKDGQYHDIAFPTTKELRLDINKAILDEYKEAAKNLDKSAQKSETPTPKPKNDEPEMG